MSIEVEAARAREIGRDLAIVDRPVHADVEELPLRARIVDRRRGSPKPGRRHARNCASAGARRRRAAAARCPSWHSASRRLPGPCVFQSGPPNTSSPNDSVYLKSSFSMIHGARRQQPLVSYWMPNCSSITSSRTLDKRIAARIGHVRRIFGDRPVMAIKEMADPGIAADQDELAGGRARAEIPRAARTSPLTVTSMTSSGVSLQVARCTTCVTPSSAARPRRRGRRSSRVTTSTRSVSSHSTVVAKRPDPRLGKSRIVKQPRR